MNLKRLVELKRRSERLVPKFYGSKKYEPKSCYINHTKISEPFPNVSSTRPSALNENVENEKE